MPFRLIVAAMLAAVSASPALAGATTDGVTYPTQAKLVAVCHIGADPTPAGSTLTRAADAVTVSPREAKCVLDHYDGHVLVIAAMGDVDQLPNAHPFPSLGAPPRAAETDTDATVKRKLSNTLGAHHDFPVLVYCHHTSCIYPYNAAIRLQDMGYTNILWMREGIAGWKKAGYPLKPFEQTELPFGDSPARFWGQAIGPNAVACNAGQIAACERLTTALDRSGDGNELTDLERIRLSVRIATSIARTAELHRQSGHSEKGMALLTNLLALADRTDTASTPMFGMAIGEYMIDAAASGHVEAAAQRMEATRHFAKQARDMIVNGATGDQREALQRIITGADQAEKRLDDYRRGALPPAIQVG